MIWRRLLTMAAVVGLAAGCNSEPFKIAPVSGQVTLNGKPVPQVEVSFNPIATEGNNSPGPGSYGRTDAAGHYALKLIGTETKGAVVGKHKVRFSAYVEPGDPADDGPIKNKPAVKIPAKYWSDPKFEFDVPDKGTKEANFQLTSP
jgi:hypothetical protein